MIWSWLFGRRRVVDDDGDDDEWDPEAPVEIAVDGTLDLHNFSPKEVGELVPDYLEACRARDLTSARVIHGKGTGALRKRVHKILDRLVEAGVVESYQAGDGGNWGATDVVLAQRSRKPS